MEYIPEVYVRASRSLGASRLREFFLVIIPAAAPHILAGIRLGVALAFLSLVAAELSGASSGLGYRLQEARQYIRTDRMFRIADYPGCTGCPHRLRCHWIGSRLVHWNKAERKGTCSCRCHTKHCQAKVGVEIDHVSIKLFVAQYDVACAGRNEACT